MNTYTILRIQIAAGFSLKSQLIKNSCMTENTGALMSGKKRYRLWRIWDANQPLLLYILLNPSIGDATQEDPTLRRLRYFTEKFNYGGFYVGNLYPHITAKPKELYALKQLYDTHNEKHLKELVGLCDKVVYGWGQKEQEPPFLQALVSKPYCFGYNQNRTPKHPLYLAHHTTLVPYKRTLAP